MYHGQSCAVFTYLEGYIICTQYPIEMGKTRGTIEESVQKVESTALLSIIIFLRFQSSRWKRCQIPGQKALTMRTEAPNDLAGKLLRKRALTVPEPPWARVTRPQMQRILEPLTSRLAR